MAELNELDAAILRELQKNARQTNRAIADAVHVAPSTSLERIRSLQERGVIRGYHAEADLAAVGREVQALIAIRIRPPSRENIEAFRDWARRLPETVGVFVVSGGDDFLLHVAVPSTDALYALVIDRLTERPEVADVNTSIVYEHLRNFTIEPLGRAETHDGTRAHPKPTVSMPPRSDGSTPAATRKEGN
jgi:DNA-binding Lrp family transcriptional regulator